MIRLRSIRPDRGARKLSLSTAAALALLLLALAAACGGDDDDGTPTNVDTGRGGTNTPADQPSPTIPADARPANLLEDPSTFLAQYSEEILAQAECGYDETNGVVDCSEAGAGLIDLVPDLPASTDIECHVLLSQETPVALRCKGQDPLFASVYELED